MSAISGNFFWALHVEVINVWAPVVFARFFRELTPKSTWILQSRENLLWYFCIISGDFDAEKFKDNIRSAIDNYISVVDDTDAMGTKIKLYKGVEGSSYLVRRPHLLTFLKGSKAAKNELQVKQPFMYNYFQSIWKLRTNHMVTSDIPVKYAFVLGCCGDAQCIHPLCAGGNLSPMEWYPGGPTIKDTLPIPVISHTRCNCKGNCGGHYRRDITNLSNKAAPAPSIYLAAKFSENESADGARITVMSKKCLLSEKDVQFYWKHMQDVKRNKLRGIEKAKKTRESKKLKPQ